MRRNVRWIVLGACGALGVLVFWSNRRRSIMTAETATVMRGTFEETLVEVGRTRVRWHVDVSAPMTGEWSPASLRVGDTVAAGRALGTLSSVPQDPATARQLAARLGVAEATLDAARSAEAAAQLAVGEVTRTLARTERLAASGGVSAERLDQVRTETDARRRNLEAVRAQTVAAEFGRDAARALLPGTGGPVRLRAPVSGIVLRMDEEHRRVVPAGSPLLMLGALGVPDVIVDVPSSQAQRIIAGAPLYIVSGTDTVAGRVLRVEPVAHTVRSVLGVDEQRVTVVGDIGERNAHLGHDFEVQVHIVLSRLGNVLIVPTGALVQDSESWFVFEIDDNDRVHRRSIRILGRSAEQAAVEGIEAARRIVLYPAETLTEGQRVRP